MADTTQPYFSIVVPCYNAMPYLARTIDFVLNQSYGNFELIIINDGSTDDTEDYLFNIDDQRLKIVTIENSGGPARPRNIGIKIARGKYISFLDADDIWYSDKLKIIYQKIIELGDFDLITNSELLNNQLTKQKRVLNYGVGSKNKYKELLLWGNRFSPSATFINLDFLRKVSIEFDERIEYSTVEDYDFWLNLHRHDINSYHVTQVLGEYLIHGSNSISNVERHYENFHTMIQNHLNSQSFLNRMIAQHIIKTRMTMSKLQVLKLFDIEASKKIIIYSKLILSPITVILILVKLKINKMKYK